MERLRLAANDDLPQLKEVYKKVVAKIKSQGINIWNEFYPFEEFAGDIKRKGLFIYEDADKNIIGAFCLTSSDEYENFFEWEEVKSNPVYVCRLAVAVSYMGKGFAKKMMGLAEEMARSRMCPAIRLTVYDKNFPAIGLYKKLGFKIVKGKAVISQNRLLLGYEKKLNPLT